MWHGKAAELRSRLGLFRPVIVGLAMAGIVLSSCGPVVATTLPPVPASDTPAPTSTSSPTATPDSSTQLEPETAFLSSDYNLNGQIEMIPGSERATYEYFLRALMLTNPLYTEDLLGVQIIKDGLQDGEYTRMLNYLRQADYVLPKASINAYELELPAGLGNLLDVRLKPVRQNVRLRNLTLEIISYEQFAVVDPLKLPELLPWPLTYFDAGGKFGGARQVGVSVRRRAGENYAALTLQALERKQVTGSGFPKPGDAPTESNAKQIDSLIRFALYQMRSMSVNPPVVLYSTSPEDKAQIEKKGKWVGHIGRINWDTLTAGYLNPQFHTIFTSADPEDGPAEMIRLAHK